MGDMGDVFRDMRKQVKAKRNARLDAFDSADWVRLSDQHFRKIVCGDPLDYWPSTDCFVWRGKKYHGGVDGFIKKRSKEE